MIYAINKQTKEHRVTRPSGVYSSWDWRFVEADADGWIKWDGSAVKPLPDNHEFEWKIKGGHTARGCNPQYLLWSAVTAYRPILSEQPVEQPVGGKWDGSRLSPVGTVCELSEECEFFSLASGEVTTKPEGTIVSIVGHAKRFDSGAECITIQPVDDMDCGFATGNYELIVRPIRTPEQRAEENAITRLQAVSQGQIGAPISATQAINIYRAIKSGELQL